MRTWVLTMNHSCSAPQDVPSIWEKEHQVGACAPQGVLTRSKVSSLVQEETRVLVLSWLSMYEEATLLTSQSLAEKPEVCPKRGPEAHLSDQSLHYSSCCPIQVCVSPGPRTGHLCVAGVPGHTEQHH